mgnify:CR=1 FL=1
MSDADSPRILAIIAAATGGAVNTPQLCATPSAVQDTFLAGKLVDRSGFYFEQEAPGPLVITRCAASTAGSLPAYARQASDALAGNAGANAFLNLVFSGPANIECVFVAAYDGGNVTLTGTAVGGAAQTKIIKKLGSSVRLNLAQYRELQKLGNFDTKTSSWVHTPADIRKLGGALFCDRRYETTFLYHNGADSYYAARGFRGALSV